MSVTLAAATPVSPRRCKRRVLLADSDSTQRASLEPMLPPSMAITRVGTGSRLEEELQRGDFDLVITAANLDAENAIETLARVRASGDRTPFMVYSSLRESLTRVLVSQVDEALLSSRILDLEGIGSTARMLLDRRRQSD